MTLFIGRILLVLAAATAQQGTLRDARIRITLHGDTARVTARYRVTDAGDSLRFSAIRFATQEFAFDRRFQDPRLSLDTLPGLFRLTTAGRGRMLALELRYAVLGDLSRIPLFVPESPTSPGESRLAILVDGLAPERVSRYVFPRFTRAASGAWVAAPDHLPSFVALVESPGALPVAALAQWSVVLIAVGGTGAWLLVQLRSRRRA